MDQYLWKYHIFSGLFTSIYHPSYFDVNYRGFHGFWHTANWLKPWQAGQFQQQKKNREDEVKVGCVPPLVDDQPFFFYPNLPKILGITIINHHNHQKNHCLPSIMESFLGFEHRASEYIIVYMSQDLISFYINGWTMLNHVTSCIEFMYGVCWNQWYFVGPAMSGIWGWLLLQPRFWGHHGSFESFERRSRDMKHPGTGRGHHQGSLVMSQR